MTTLEFVTKNLEKAKLVLETQKKKPNVHPTEIENLTEKVNHYQTLLEILLKADAE